MNIKSYFVILFQIYRLEVVSRQTALRLIDLSIFYFVSIYFVIKTFQVKKKYLMYVSNRFIFLLT